MPAWRGGTRAIKPAGAREWWGGHPRAVLGFVPHGVVLGRLMRRREFIIGSVAAAWPLVARAQQAMPVVGVLSPVSAATSTRSIAGLRRGLHDLGYIEGRNVKIEYRF